MTGSFIKLIGALTGAGAWPGADRRHEGAVPGAAAPAAVVATLPAALRRGHPQAAAVPQHRATAGGLSGRSVRI